MNYQTDLAKQQADELQRSEDALTQRNLIRIFAKYPSLDQCDANINEIISYCAPDAVTMEGFELHLRNGRFGFAVKPAENQKAVVFAEIEALLRGKPTYIGSKLIKLDNVRFNLPSTTTSQLKQLLAEIKDSQEMQSQSPEELCRRIQASAPNYDYPRMPKTFVPYGSVQAVPLDRDAIRGMDSDELRLAIRKYGEQQVNARLNGLD
jgi:hypothetical protein